jgi:hypothetical protein
MRLKEIQDRAHARSFPKFSVQKRTLRKLALAKRAKGL